MVHMEPEMGAPEMGPYRLLAELQERVLVHPSSMRDLGRAGCFCRAGDLPAERVLRQRIKARGCIEEMKMLERGVARSTTNAVHTTGPAVFAHTNFVPSSFSNAELVKAKPRVDYFATPQKTIKKHLGKTRWTKVAAKVTKEIDTEARKAAEAIRASEEAAEAVEAAKVVETAEAAEAAAAETAEAAETAKVAEAAETAKVVETAEVVDDTVVVREKRNSLAWTLAEDQLLIYLRHEHGPCWKKMSKVMDRSPCSLRGRWARQNRPRAVEQPRCGVSLDISRKRP